MCGRFTLQSPVDDLKDLFDFRETGELVPRYNVAPTQQVAVVREEVEGEGRELVTMRWGLVPFFMKDMSSSARMINARSETAAVKPSFREAFRRRRCLVPADGFIEWQKRPDGKQPYWIGLRDGAPFGMAGLWESWRGPDGIVESCAVLTTSANELVSTVHDRMPVILAPDDFALWLDRGTESPELVQPLLEPCHAAAMSMREVSRRVNSPRHDDPACLQGPEEQGSLFD